MQDYDTPPERSWLEKFRDAFLGVELGIRGQSSFFVHLFIAAAVVAAAIVLRAILIEWCVLLLCIAGVLTAEMFNSALESLSRAISREHNPDLGAALDMGSAAVLMAAIGAAIIGGIVFTHRLGAMAGWW